MCMCAHLFTSILHTHTRARSFLVTPLISHVTPPPPACTRMLSVFFSLSISPPSGCATVRFSESSGGLLESCLVQHNDIAIAVNDRVRCAVYSSLFQHNQVCVCGYFHISVCLVCLRACV